MDPQDIVAAESTEIEETNATGAVDESVDEYVEETDADDTINDDTVLIDQEGTFTCVECENSVTAQVSGENGSTNVNVEALTEQLTSRPEVAVFGFCPVCGMEYQFKVNAEGILILLPSDEEK